MRPRVALVGPIAPLRGGIASHSARLVEALARGGWAVEVLSYSRLYPRLGFPGSSQFLDPAAALDATPEAEPHARVHTLLDTLDPRSWRRSAACLARMDPARVVVQWWHPVTAPALIWLLSGRQRQSVTILCHNLLPHEAFPLARRLARATLGRAGLVVCHSRRVADQVLGLLPTARVETVELAPLIDPDRQSGFDPRAWAAARYGFAAGSPLVLMAGHLRSYKGVEVLLEAWRLRPRRGTAGERLLLVGECYLRGSARRRVLAAVAADPSIVFVNRYVDDGELVRLLRICRVLVLPYLRASQSGILPLATALGVPCLVSDAGALAEQAPAARVLASGDAGALAAALGEVLADRRAGEAGAEAAMTGRGAGCAAKRDGDFHAQWRSLVEVVSGGVRP
ncbi:MAG: glycosyltransferase [Deltaproteobacteria bacterium]|nr:glycosyltransferase [Deltaproteobacteria bacterium]